MTTTPDTLTALFRANADQGFRLALAAFDGSEKLLRLNLQLAHDLMAEASRAATVTVAERGNASLFVFQSPLGAGNAGPWLDYTRQVGDIVRATGRQWQEIFEEGNAGVMQGGFASLFDTALRAMTNMPERG